jgi:hypothetical protein
MKTLFFKCRCIAVILRPRGQLQGKWSGPRERRSHDLRKFEVSIRRHGLENLSGDNPFLESRSRRQELAGGHGLQRLVGGSLRYQPHSASVGRWKIQVRWYMLHTSQREPSHKKFRSWKRPRSFRFAENARWRS